MLKPFLVGLYKLLFVNAFALPGPPSSCMILRVHRKHVRVVHHPKRVHAVCVAGARRQRSFARRRRAPLAGTAVPAGGRGGPGTNRHGFRPRSGRGWKAGTAGSGDTLNLKNIVEGCSNSVTTINPGSGSGSYCQDDPFAVPCFPSSDYPSFYPGYEDSPSHVPFRSFPYHQTYLTIRSST